MNTIILGMGNTLLSDDAIGILIVRYLRRKIGLVKNITFKETSWGGFAIIDFLNNYDYAIVIDSIVTKNKPAGFIHQLTPNDLLPTLRLNSYHDINFITAIKLGEYLKADMPSDIDIFAVEVEDARTINEGLTQKVFDSVCNCSKLIISKLNEKNLLPSEFEKIHNLNKLEDEELKMLYQESNEENYFQIYQNQQV